MRQYNKKRTSKVGRRYNVNTFLEGSAVYTFTPLKLNLADSMQLLMPIFNLDVTASILSSMERIHGLFCFGHVPFVGGSDFLEMWFVLESSSGLVYNGSLQGVRGLHLGPHGNLVPHACFGV